MAGSADRWICVWGVALAEPGAGADYVHRRGGDGVVVREGTEYCAAGVRASGIGIADLVGFSTGMASFDAGGAGILDVQTAVKQKAKIENQKVVNRKRSEEAELETV